MPTAPLNGVGAGPPPPPPMDSEPAAPPPTTQGEEQPEAAPGDEQPQAAPAPGAPATAAETAPPGEQVEAVDQEPQDVQPESGGDTPIGVIKDTVDITAHAIAAGVGGEIGQAAGAAADKLAEGANAGVDWAIGEVAEEARDNVELIPVIGDELSEGVDYLEKGAHALSDQADDALRGWVADGARDKADERQDEGLMGEAVGAGLNEFANAIDPPPADDTGPAPGVQGLPPEPPPSIPDDAVLVGAALGPSTEGGEEQLIQGGADVLSIDAWDRDLERVGEDIAEVKAAESAAGREINLVVDLQDPGKVRLGEILGGSVELTVDQAVGLDPYVNQPGTLGRIGIENFSEMVGGRRRVRPGDILEFGGAARGEVKAVGRDKIELQIIDSGYVGSHETVRSLRDRGLPVPDLSATDYEFAADAFVRGADAIALSVDNPRDVTTLRSRLPQPPDQQAARVVATIDSARALPHIHAIAQAADMLVIDPEAMSLDVGMQQLLQVQQDIERAARENGKPVMVGGMLDSMRFGEQSTAADALNVAYAAQDGLGPMLADATRLGRNPALAVEAARGIADQAVVAGDSGGPGGPPQSPAQIITTLEAWLPGTRPEDPITDQGRIAQLVRAGADTVMFDATNLHPDTAIAQRQLSQAMELAIVAQEDTAPFKRMVDLGGPRVRIGNMPVGGSRVEADASLVLDASMTQSEVGDASRVGVPIVPGYARLVEDVRVGDVLRIGDGVKLEVTRVAGDEVDTRVLEGGVLDGADGIRLMGDREFSGSPFTRREIDLLRIAEMGQAHGTVVTVPGFDEFGGISDDRAAAMPLMARIENDRDAQQLPGVIARSAAVIIDREALLQDVGAAQLLPTQRRIIDAANAAGKPVYLDGALRQMATVFGDRPSVAEAMDVAYGRQHGANGFILPVRTMADQHSADPTAAVRMLASIARGVR